MSIEIEDKTVIRRQSDLMANEDKTRIKQQSTIEADDELKTVIKSDQSTEKTVINPQTLNRATENPASLPKSATANKILKNRFQLQKVLGIGGMGVVFKAVDLRKVEAKDRNPYIAIKVLNEEFRQHPDSLIALQREARKSQSIAHPNIVNVHDFDRDGDTVFMTMEYLEGQPLDELLRQYQYIGLPLTEAWVVFRGMCEALKYAHDENIIHSDFKPGNIFVTNKGVPKVFDFGIARAVQYTGNKAANDGDKTLFDAGTLGALTPSYASMEMLQGNKPDTRDDIYALACVTYEIFCGEHPFNKMPADKAYEKKLKPKRISELSGAQWQILKKGLAFKREDRITSVDVFMEGMLREKNSKKLFVSAAAVLILTALGVFSTMQMDQTQQNSDIQNEAAVNEIKMLKETATLLLEKPTFSNIWDEELWATYKALWKVLPENDSWLMETEQNITVIYSEQISRLIDGNKLDEADVQLIAAGKYTDHLNKLNDIKLALDKAHENHRQALYSKYEQEKALQQAKFKREQSRLRQQITQEQKQEYQGRKREYNLALNEVSRHLLCRDGLNARKFGQSLAKLKSIDNNRYMSEKNKIVQSTIDCIQKVAKTDTDKAKMLQGFTLQLFPGENQITSLEFGVVDQCKANYAGIGGKNPRAYCLDELPSGGYGPKMIVVKDSSNNSVYAISKYEVSYQEYNHYCKDTGKCEVVNGKTELPVTNLSFQDALDYISWLSEKTQHNYKIPLYAQWLNAAKANSSFVDPNRNCTINSRGIVKGDALVSSNSGKQNEWGLVNYVGNAQEWVYKHNSQLYVAGGSYQDQFSECRIEKLVKHDGSASEITGFRVVREIL